MPAPKVYQTEAIVLHSIRLGEADKILTLYTPYLGKLKGIAKGVCRPRSKLGGHVELLTYSQMMLARGQNLDVVTQSQTLNSFLPIREDLWRTSCALYAAELTNRFTPEDSENRPIFQLLLDTLLQLCQSQRGEFTLRYFELHLLACLGYRPRLDACSNCNSALQPTTNFFSPAAGGALCPACGSSQPLTQPLSVNALKVLRFMQQEPYASANRLKIGAALGQELEQLMRSYVRYYLEREVKSGIWLDKLKKEIRTSNGALNKGESTTSYHSSPLTSSGAVDNSLALL